MEWGNSELITRNGSTSSVLHKAPIIATLLPRNMRALQAGQDVKTSKNSGMFHVKLSAPLHQLPPSLYISKWQQLMTRVAGSTAVARCSAAAVIIVGDFNTKYTYAIIIIITTVMIIIKAYQNKILPQYNTQSDGCRIDGAPCGTKTQTSTSYYCSMHLIALRELTK